MVILGRYKEQKGKVVHSTTSKGEILHKLKQYFQQEPKTAVVELLGVIHM